MPLASVEAPLVATAVDEQEEEPETPTPGGIQPLVAMVGAGGEFGKTRGPTSERFDADSGFSHAATHQRAQTFHA